MRVGYVCTNFNNSTFTVDAVRTLLSNKRHDIRIAVVDNASGAESLGKLLLLENDYPCVRVIQCKENVGYFRGLNVGIRYLRNEFAGVDWMVVGNNDLEFPDNFIDVLETNAERFRAHAVVSPDVVTIEGEHQNPHVIAGISKLRELFYDLYYSNYYVAMLIQKLARTLPSVSERSDEEHWQTAQPIHQGHGSCYVLTPRFFEQFSELWAPTFLMGEEYFLSKQLSDVGQQVYYDPTLQVVHHWHGSLAKLPNKARWAMARDAHREYRKYVKVFR